MKKVTILLGVSLFFGTILPASLPVRIGNFILEPFARGLNSKKIMALSMLCAGTYLVFSKKISKKRIVKGAGIVFAIAGTCGLPDTVRARLWPNDADFAERDENKKADEALAQAKRTAASLKKGDLKNEYLKQINQFDIDIQEIQLDRKKSAVRAEFNKMLSQHQEEDCELGALPQSCAKIAQEYRALWGEEKYQEEVAAFHRLRRVDLSKIFQRA